MITLTNLTMGFSQRTLFKDVTFSIFPKERVGLTGPNGAGKTTLFSIIRGEVEPVSGNVSIQKNINIGYLPQEAHFTSERTVMDELTSGDQRIQQLLREKHKLEDEHKADSERYGDVLHELEQLGIYELEHKAEKVLMGLGFKEADFARPICELSGGWQMRTLLAKMLVYPYDLILLDEPTNYLDLAATLWLKQYLATYPGAFVLISHDRVFLNDVTNFTIILSEGGMSKIKGNYETYEMQREIRLKTLERQQKVVEKKREQLERFAQRFHAQPNRASAVKNKRKMIDKLERIELPQEHRSIKEFEFDNTEQSGYQVIDLQGVSKAYGEKRVYTDLDFSIVRGQKVCLVGPNGAGKSTLLKMLAGAIEQDKGQIKYGHKVEKGYFSQTRLDVLNPLNNAFEEVAAAAPQGVQSVKVRSLLALFNFHGDDVFKPVKVLSGGEKSRLILAKLLIKPPNFMLLDEPTTHLDLDGVKALTSAFKRFDGTVCFISHDLFFIREIADHIVEIDQGQVKSYPGGLQYYLDKKGQGYMVGESAPEEQSKAKKEKKPKDAGATHEEDDAQEGSSRVDELQKKHQQAKKRIQDIKQSIKELEQEKKELETESYVKARVMSEAYEVRDAERIKEYGQRLKYIQGRLRDIESTIKALLEEKDQISR